jgi:ParB-like chromosome segregation protein Spo0J
MNTRIVELLLEVKKEFEGIKDIDEKVKMLNLIRTNIADISPFEEPVDCVRWIPTDKVKANEYNPNRVASTEMKLLHTSIKLDGYTQPIVAYKLDNGEYEVVDGFHRNRVGKEYKDINKRIHGYLPLVILDKPLDERIGSTIRHNRARGTHQIRSMSEIVIDLSKAGWTDEEICKKIGMELDEVIKLKQITGLKEAFQNHEFSKSWEEFEKKYYENK